MIFCQPVAPATPVHSHPKIVVGIIIDQMRNDYILKYWDKYQSGGFRKLVEKGFYCKNTHYNYAPTYTAPGHASVYTGTSPANHGIIANDWYDKASGKDIYCVFDKSTEAVGSTKEAGQMSPKNLLSSTITDELKLYSNSKSKVVGISLKDRGSILPAGHAADAAYWFEAESGNWITSSYYMKSLPDWVSAYNGKKYPEAYIAGGWNTLLPINQYYESASDDSPFEEPFKGETKAIFPHDLKMIQQKDQDIIRKTPFGNTLTKDFAKEAIINEKMGQGYYTDFLALSFSSPDYIGHQFGPASVELEDNYIRLDRDLADLISFLEKRYGSDNFTLFLTADHAAAYSLKQMESMRIPADNFETKSLRKKLDEHINSRFKGSNLILSFSNLQIFLNHAEIMAKKKDQDSIVQECMNFMLQQEGVKEVYDIRNGHLSSTNSLSRVIEAGINTKRSGDIAVVHQSGWMDYRNTGTSHGSPFNYDTHVPLLWYGKNIRKGSTEQEVNIVDIAPTLAELMGINEPNSCTGKVIEGVIKGDK